MTRIRKKKPQMKKAVRSRNSSSSKTSRRVPSSYTRRMKMRMMTRMRMRTMISEFDPVDETG